jgi:hypothetical protein
MSLVLMCDLAVHRRILEHIAGVLLEPATMRANLSKAAVFPEGRTAR